MNLSRLVGYVALILFACLLPERSVQGACSQWHPYHVSNAEVNWNPKSGNFEVALCVWPADLERALAQDLQRSIDLDKVENLDSLILAYVEKRFLIRPAGTPESHAGVSPDVASDATTIRWVGQEHNLKTAWLYFEVQGGKQGPQWTIENRMFFELNDDQLNHVEATVGKSSTTFVCRRSESRHPVDTTRIEGKRGH